MSELLITPAHSYPPEFRDLFMIIMQEARKPHVEYPPGSLYSNYLAPDFPEDERIFVGIEGEAYHQTKVRLGGKVRDAAVVAHANIQVPREPFIIRNLLIISGTVLHSDNHRDFRELDSDETAALTRRITPA